jgi:hypothetical protein
MVHGNVRISSIFTNKAGEWKLGGFELLDSMKEESPMIMVSRIQDVIAVGLFTNKLYTRLLVG